MERGTGAEPARAQEITLSSEALLGALHVAQEAYISGQEVGALFGRLLEQLLALTGAEYGFIGEVLRDDDGTPFLKTHAITNIAWDEQTRRFYDENIPRGLEFRSLGNLFGAVLTSGRAVLANDPASDPRRGGLPPGHPPLRSFLGLPFLKADELIGMVGLANRPGGFDEELARRLAPFQSTCASIIEATRAKLAHRAQAANLRASEARLCQALDIARAGNWEYDVAADRFTFNDNFYRMLRTTAAREGGYEMSSSEYAHRFCHPDDMVVVGRETQAAIEATDPGYSREIEHRVIFGDGEVGHITVRFFVVKDENGRTIRTRGVNQDITERTRAEQQVKLFRELVDHSNDAIEVLDVQTLRFIDVNEQACRDLGYSRDEMVTLTLADIDPEHSAERAARVRKDLERSGSVVIEALHRRKDGSTYPVEVSISLVQVDQPYIVAVARDVTERKRAEQQREEILSQLRQSQKMDALGRLAGGVAHDFNNLLVIINNYATFLLEALEPGDPRHEDAAEILKAGERAATLTKQLLAFSRQRVIEPKRLSAHQVVGDIERMLRRMLGEDVELQVELEAPRTHIIASPGAMDQILINLAVNARDAMPDGGRLTIRAREIPSGSAAGRVTAQRTGRCLEISVTDSGGGMSPEVLEHVFEPFYTTKPEGRGTGLGLATVYGIVRQLGGDVQIQSSAGAGTTVRVILPALAGSSTRLPRLGKQARDLQRPVTVLLVEDEEQVRRMTARILRSRGIVVHEAANGAEALEVVERLGTPVDLLVTDVVMPTMNGPAVAKDIRRKFPGKPVLFISGYAQHESLTELLTAPTVRFLSKPFTPGELLCRIEELLAIP